MSGGTFFFALNVPGIDATMDPDDLADSLVAVLNERRQRADRITVSAIPSPQWLTPTTLANLKRAAAGETA